MKDFIRLTDLHSGDVDQIFRIADEMKQGKRKGGLREKSAVLFFPDSSLRTRVTFEKGIYLQGGQSIRFPAEVLEKKEDLRDVCGYLDQWADLVVVRHKDIRVIETMAKYLDAPVVNAMTDCNHPCEVLSDLYALSKMREDFRKDKYLFCGKAGNIGFSWKEAAQVLGLDLTQCCGKGYEMEGVKNCRNIWEAVVGKDVICTDSLPSSMLPDFKDCQVTLAAMRLANEGAVLNPCPPFYRGEEVTEEVVGSKYFVGYGFKESLLWVQQAVVAYCLGEVMG
ncbi:MAG: peptide transporter [Lachnospiraceae bacterium]|nr:peptide transporter [Lachnospiraceae bacterium]